MTLYELMARFRGSDDISVVISVLDREYDDDIRTTAFAIQSNEPYCEDDYEVNNSYVTSWYFVDNELYVEVECR